MVVVVLAMNKKSQRQVRRTSNLGIAVGPPSASLAVGRPEGKRSVAVLDRFLVVPKLRAARSSIKEKGGVLGIVIQAFSIGNARLGELGRLEEIVSPRTC